VRRRRVALAALGAALLLACGGRARRLEEANALRLKGDPKGALAGYKVLLADLGDAPLPAPDAKIRSKALRFAGDVSYLELGDYTGAIAYYRRIISLYPGGKEAREARITIGDIYRERFRDLLAAVTQYADVASSDAPEAPKYQLEVARAYLELKNWSQARTEARVLRERWPTHELADEAQLLTAQAWALEKRDAEAIGAFEALIERKPRPEMEARALEGEAHILAQAGRFDRALELYARALPIHPNPEAIRTNIQAVSDRQKRSQTGRPGDRAAAFDHRKASQTESR
jgi:tetratricopeptide (TPR) repeat protein